MVLEITRLEMRDDFGKNCMYQFFFFQLTKIFSPEKTPEMQPGSVKAGMKLFITQVSQLAFITPLFPFLIALGDMSKH